MTLFAEVMRIFAEQDATDITVFGGGIIPQADIPALRALGVAAMFTPGTPLPEITDRVHTHVRPAPVQRAAGRG